MNRVDVVLRMSLERMLSSGSKFFLARAIADGYAHYPVGGNPLSLANAGSSNPVLNPQCNHRNE